MSKSRMRLAIIGNCQAEALRSILYKADSPFEIIDLPEYHTMTPAGAGSVVDLLTSADLVMAQRAAPNFCIEEVRPSNLREKLGEKCVVWPNIYFDGYCPGLRYVYGSDGRKLVGPLGDYHFEQIIGCWLQGLEPEVAAADLASTEGWEWCPGDPVEASLENLRKREVDCHVGISDHIARNYASRKLMYAMNHPRNSVLLEMLDRMLNYAGIENNYRLRAAHQIERLAHIDIPTLPRYFETQGVPACHESFFDGFGEPYDEVRPTPRRYTLISLVTAFYSLYQKNRSLLAPPETAQL